MPRCGALASRSASTRGVSDGCVRANDASRSRASSSGAGRAAGIKKRASMSLHSSARARSPSTANVSASERASASTERPPRASSSACDTGGVAAIVTLRYCVPSPVTETLRSSSSAKRGPSRRSAVALATTTSPPSPSVRSAIASTAPTSHSWSTFARATRSRTSSTHASCAPNVTGPTDAKIPNGVVRVAMRTAYASNRTAARSSSGSPRSTRSTTGRNPALAMRIAVRNTSSSRSIAPMRSRQSAAPSSACARCAGHAVTRPSVSSSTTVNAMFSAGAPKRARCFSGAIMGPVHPPQDRGEPP